MSTTIPSFFVDVYSVTYTPGIVGGSGTPIQIFAVKSIGFDRSETIVKGMDNNKLRPVAVHTVSINDTVTIDTEDGAGLENLITAVGQGYLTFNWRAAAHNSVGVTQLADQTVTITGLVWEKKTLQQPTKASGSYKLSGFCMENTAGDSTDVISFTAASSPPVSTAN